MNVQNLIRNLENGICPPELSYKGDYNSEAIDWEKVLYNVKYHQPQFYEDKFPNEIHNLPAFDQLIDMIIQKNEDNSPLKEIENKQNEIENDSRKILNKEYDEIDDLTTSNQNT
jgi:hypothetical protein